MLTDDDLTRQLGAAFRDTTDDLRYAGRVPVPRSGVPLVATAATVATLAGVWVAAPDTDTAPTPPTTTPLTTAPPTRPAPSPAAPAAEPELVTETFRVAGFTFAVRREPGAARIADLLHISYADAVPASARPVDVEPPTRAWVGTDPRTGDPTMYLRTPRYDGRLFALSIPGLSEAEMERTLLSGVRR